jgi:hypothetical protein
MKITLQIGLFAAFYILAYQCLTLANDISSYADITELPALVWIALGANILAMFATTFAYYLVDTKLITKECE